MAQSVEIGTRNTGEIVVRIAVVVVRESISKVAAWATHGGEKERFVIGSGGVSKRPHMPLLG